MEHTALVRQFFSELNDFQLIIFCMSYGYNEWGIVLTATELARFLGSKQSTVWFTLDSVTIKLSTPRFMPLIEAIKNYETLETINN